MTLPQWFVQTEDGTIHGYFNLDILMCDLFAHRGSYARILELVPGVIVKYQPVTYESLRDLREVKILKENMS